MATGIQQHIMENPNYQHNKEDEAVPFWSENPNILLQQAHIFEFFPVESMSYEQKLNAVTRTIIALTIISFLFTRNIRLLVISAMTIFAIYMLYVTQTKERRKKEAFGPALAYLNQADIAKPSDAFVAPDSHNPMNNVLVTDYEYNPQRKPAPAAFNENVGQDILSQAKRMVIEANPDQPDIANKLFQDLGDEFVFEQSMRPFHSNPATTIPNDQGAFADFCYGSMVSCKEGNMFACARNLSRHVN